MTDDDSASTLKRFLRRVPRRGHARDVVDAILEAADRELDVAARGSLRRIFTRAGVAAGSFYEYFASRDALLGAVLERSAQKYFDEFLALSDQLLATPASLEEVIRTGAEGVVARYLARPAHAARIIGVAADLGLLGRIADLRDEFADHLAYRFAARTPELSEAERSAAFRDMCEAVTGVFALSLYRVPPVPAPEVQRRAADVAWALLALRLDGARADHRGDNSD